VNRRRIQLVLVFGVASLLAAVGVAVATGGRDIRERLTGYEEDPLVISTPANGEFKARISRFSEEIEYRLSYRGFETDVTQAHIHFGGRHQSGGISVWLCGNPSATVMPPAGTPACPLREGTVEGVLEPEDVVGPTGQGIAPGEFDELVDAIRAGVTYANVHSGARPGGEIRAQLVDDDDRRW
jgi:CHRD domain-containing protein